MFEGLTSRQPPGKNFPTSESDKPFFQSSKSSTKCDVGWHVLGSFPKFFVAQHVVETVTLEGQSPYDSRVIFFLLSFLPLSKHCRSLYLKGRQSYTNWQFQELNQGVASLGLKCWCFYFFFFSLFFPFFLYRTHTHFYYSISLSEVFSCYTAPLY